MRSWRNPPQPTAPWRQGEKGFGGTPGDAAQNAELDEQLPRSRLYIDQ
jgi:hypothetical protein